MAMSETKLLLSSSSIRTIRLNLNLRTPSCPAAAEGQLDMLMVVSRTRRWNGQRRYQLLTVPSVSSPGARRRELPASGAPLKEGPELAHQLDRPAHRPE